MALFKVISRARILTNGILIEPGMSVEISTISAVSPITANAGQAVADAFMRIWYRFEESRGFELCVFRNN